MGFYLFPCPLILLFCFSGFSCFSLSESLSFVFLLFGFWIFEWRRCGLVSFNIFMFDRCNKDYSILLKYIGFGVI